jgi:hypothetical protein
MRRLFFLAAFALPVGTMAFAQPAPVTPGWAAFSGCWNPVAVPGAEAASGARVCVVPSGPNGADLVSIKAADVVERTHIEADGQHHDVSRQGCAGWESAAFSSDGRRLYLSGEQQCAGMKRQTSGLFAIGRNGEWINVVNVSADSGKDLRVATYALASADGAPPEIKSQVESRELANRTARIAAQSRVSTKNVVEASRYLSAPVIEGWLSELGQEFELDDRALIQLADAGVQSSVIDVMVAVSNPKVFAVRTTGTGVSTEENPDEVTRRRARRDDCVAPLMDPWGYSAYDPCDPYRRYGYYGSRWYQYGNRYNAYNDPYGYYYGAGYQPVVIVVKGSATGQNAGHGRMTKDGYSPGTAQPSGTTQRAEPAKSSEAPAPREREAEKSSSPAGGSSSGRTATRKPPTG